MSGSHGTAFFIDTHGVFLTAAHVIKGVVENKEKCEIPAVLVRADGRDSSCVQRISSQRPDAVHGKGNIAGYQAAEMSPNQGLQLRILVLDKPAWPESSGGPVYGVDGRVMGMLLQTGSGLAFARHGARLNEFVSSP